MFQNKLTNMLKNIVTKNILLITLGTVIYIVLLLNCYDNSNKYESKSLGTIPEQPVGVILSGSSVKQRFQCKDDNIVGFSILFATYARQNDCNVFVNVYEESGKSIFQTTFNAITLKDNTYRDFYFDNKVETKGKNVILEISSDALNPDNAITIWGGSLSDGVNEGKQLSIGDEEREEILALNFFFEKSGVSQYIWVVIPVMMMFALAIAFYPKWPLERMFLIMSLVLGLTYCLIMTPFSIPDEPHHYQRAYSMSELLSFNQLPLLKDHQNNLDFSGHMNTSNRYTQMISGLKEGIASNKELIELDSLAFYIKKYDISTFLLEIARVPPAIGVIIARLLGLNFSYIFLLGRITNLLFYVFCTYLSIKRLKEFKIALFVIALLPMSIHQAASFSSDAFINAIAFLLFSYLLCAIYETGPLEKKDWYIILIGTILISTIKVVYIPILFMLFLVNQKRFTSKKGKATKIFLVCIVALSIASISNYQSVLSLANRVPESVIVGSEEYFSLSYIINNPIETISLFFRTLERLGESFLRDSLGMTLSGLTLPIVGWVFPVLLILVLVSCLSIKGERWISNKYQRGMLATICVVIIGLIILSMFMGKPVTEVVQGVQGRYFIPILPLLLFAVRNRVIVLTKNIEAGIVITTTLMQSYIIIKIIEYTLSH